uniref:Secreted protein n=1 Tax=Triticum urartu TaxID=4572 RepID=A0A8R7PLT7_TRIUA
MQHLYLLQILRVLISFSKQVVELMSRDEVREVALHRVNIMSRGRQVHREGNQCLLIGISGGNMPLIVCTEFQMLSCVRLSSLGYTSTQTSTQQIT